MSRSRRARMEMFSRSIAVLVSLALLATGLNARQSATAASTVDPRPLAAKVESRPDLVSAVVSARSQGSKVEVESLRSETSTTWANPDGTMTTEAHAAPIRFKSANGTWQPVDLTLSKSTDGTVAPRGHRLGLQLGKRNAAAGGVFASATAGAGRQVEWLAPWKLAEPTLDGTKATYADVEPGVDLRLDARRSGFETDFVVKQRPAAAPVWRIPLRTKGLTARQAADGSVEFVDANDVVRSRIPVGQMWDAVSDQHTSLPVNTAAVSMSLEQVSPGKATLVIAPDAQWLLDPARVFPVIVDPTYANVAVVSTFDTFVQSGWPNDLSSTVDLRVGKNGSTTERSFLNFAGSAFQGRDVVSASLSLMQYGATTCAATQMNLHASLPASTATRWTNMPVTSSQVWGSVSAAKGFSSACPADRVYVDMTGLAQYWSGGTDATVAVMLKAANETDANAWKRFYSSEGPADPYISLTWNRQPNAPATVETTDAMAYAAPGDTTSYMYSSTRRPLVRTKATDPDGNTVKYVFEFMTDLTTVVGTCTSSVYASGTTAGCRPSTDLPDNTLVYIRAKANDGRIDGAWTSYQTRLRIGAATPAQPVVSCPAPYNVNSTWTDTTPTNDVTCTVTATGTGYSAPGYLWMFVDGKRPPTNYQGGGDGGPIKITPSSDPAVAKYEVTFKHTDPGLHTIVAEAQSPAGNFSSTATQRLGWGNASLSSPTADPRMTTANTIRITAAGPPKGTAPSVTARVRWRVSGYGGADDLVGWNEDGTDLPVVDNGAGGVSVNAPWDTTLAKEDIYLDSDPNTPDVQKTVLSDRVPVKLDIQVCFTYNATVQCTWSETPHTTIQRVPHAFGGGFPTSDAGPGQVALWTGEFNYSASDISVPGYTGDLSISRSHMTYETPTDQINGAFGQGWTAQFDGADDGAAGMQVIDQTRVDGTLVLQDGDGTTLIYESPSGQRRTTASYEQGAWLPVDDDTGQDGSRFTVVGSGTSTLLSYIEDDGTVTTWKPAAAPIATAPSQFRADGISEPGIAGKTSFSYDGNGRVVRILAPPAPGVICDAYVAGSPLSGLNPGCRALHLVYTTIGSSQVRLSEAWLDIYDPDKTVNGQPAPGMNSIEVAAYTYDNNALLAKVTDPRSGLSTEYTYNTSNHITSLKPAGQVPFQFNYVTVDQREKLDSVTRNRPAGDPAGGVATLGKYVYEVPLSGTGLPDLSSTSVARWNQKAVPTNGFAVFGPDHPLSAAPASDDWQYADLQYTDSAGYTINTAKYGAGDWQYTSADFDDQGNVVRQLDERALRAVIDNDSPADQLATVTVYNADIKNAAGDTVLIPAGTLVTDTYGPARWAALKNGSIAWVRSHSHATYDQNAPNAGINPDTSLPYQLVTTQTAYTQDPGTGTDLEITGLTLTDYNAPVSGDPDGWAFGLPGKTITDLDLDGTNSTGDIVKVTRYDTEGKVVESRQPASNGADAGTTKTVYYTTAANSQFANCGSKPQWAGLVCTTYPAAQPSASGATTPTLTSATTSDFTYLLAPKTEAETSGSVTRTTSIKYLPDGRMKGSTTTTAGLASPAPGTNKDTTYDSATGLATVATALNADGSTAGSATTGYDGWGRPISYQLSGELATTTVYDAAGRAKTVNDANGLTTYTYDGTDANGKNERRGLVTKVDVTSAGSTWTSTGAYDSDGSLVTQKVPGGITQYNDIDNTGEPIGLRYTGQVTTVNSDGSTTVDPNGPWLSWSVESDVAGRVTHEWTPDGTAFTTPTGGAIPYDRHYTYDNAGRLTQVNDRTAAAAGVDVTDPTQAPACVTRTYAFDANDNRLTKSTAPAAADGSCTAAGATTTTRAFDTADRPVTGANGTGNYMYDALGRATTLPASDAPRPSDGDVAVAYYDNDLVRSITQGGTTTTFTLDVLDRRSTETVTGPSGSTQTVRHYTDTSDNPTWVTQGTTSQRYADVVGGAVALTVDQAGAGDLTLNDPHGDSVAAVELADPGQAADGIGGWNNYDEYGVASSDNDMPTGLLQYGWLGGHERATSGAGLALMGSRLYNSATGLFTSSDPVPGGNSNDYTYPTDPVNQYDLDGHCICLILIIVVGGFVVISEVRGSGRAARAGKNGRAKATQSEPYHGPGHRDLKHLDQIADRLEKVHRNSRRYQGRTIGYTIYYRYRSKWHVWKYGVSSAINYMARPKLQLKSCRKMMHTKRCEIRNIRFFGNRARAYDWEHGMVAAYKARWGVFPPGQWVSGR